MKAQLSRRVKWIYFAALLLALHYSFTVYINSNFLSQFFSEQNLSLLYTAGSCITILGFIASPRLVRKFGTGTVLLIGIVLECCALLGLYSSNSHQALALFFLMHQALPPLLLFGLDVFLEDTLRSENITGRVRSMYLTISNTAFVFAPFIVSRIISLSSYRFVYLTSALFCFFLFFIVGDEIQPVKMQTLEQVNFTDTVRKIMPHRKLRIVIYLDFLLQSFYALMVIYMPLYLHQTIGFSWIDIGVLFTIMLIPFVLFEAPLGRMFDRIPIEIDTLVAGFAILCLSLIAMSYVHTHDFFLWALLLFVSRIGASFVEVGSEFSFFKRVTGRDAGFISLFRMTLPASYVIVPLVAQGLLLYISIPTLFFISGIILVSGIFYSLLLRAHTHLHA